MKKRVFLKSLSIFFSGLGLQFLGFQNKIFAESHKQNKKDLSNIVIKSNCSKCESIEGFIDPNLIDRKIYKMLHLMGSGEMGRRQTIEDVNLQKERGAIETGTKPIFYNNANCGTIDEAWAIDYTPKRNNPAIHKGIDIPKPFGEPIVAASDGTVIGIFENAWSAKGIEIMLRHTPEQTGLPFWTYSQYTHFDKMPNFEIENNSKNVFTKFVHKVCFTSNNLFTYG